MFQVPVFLYFCISVSVLSRGIPNLFFLWVAAGTKAEPIINTKPSPLHLLLFRSKEGTEVESKAQRCDSSCFPFWAMGSWWCGWKSKYIMSESVSGTLKKNPPHNFPLFPSMPWLFLQQALLSQKLKKQTKKKEEQECEPARVRVLLCFALLLFKILCQLHNSLSSPSPIFPHGQLSTIY